MIDNCREEQKQRGKKRSELTLLFVRWFIVVCDCCRFDVNDDYRGEKWGLDSSGKKQSRGDVAVINRRGLQAEKGNRGLGQKASYVSCARRL